ncbi:Tannase/feruloyl esterase [Ilyonectria robusta]|uniref:Tannase/feruloyl esterase n=1 Tax=Ilyonectria robusta TaxID=1079257 RepID=UPI001E8D01A8|nr:Tannase/feruloyl esterase [Ilyonectria robusta]KAH8669391.1 Tannase/feruloyl esterase [Ilyonectria robusta]
MDALSLIDTCVPSTFATPPAIFGTDILSIEATPITNFTRNIHSAYRFTQPSVEAENVAFCNVTVTYTHPGADDRINVEIWLPLDGWNERFYAAGGGGFAAGRFFLSYATMAGALAEGYATSTTDAGLGLDADPEDMSSWALLSPGQVDVQKLQNLASTSLNDQALISKEVIKTFYDRAPLYSYWNGCSQGGRQGLMLAQRYPTAYDGIAAGAPALEMPKLAASIFWPQQMMNMMGEYPHSCELDAITQAAISTCDKLDGVVDGLIADVESCLATFDPFQLVGTPIYCPQTDKEMQISSTAASVVNATWQGPVSASGKQIWYGFNPGSDLTGAMSYQPGIATTNCSSDGKCVSQPNVLGAQWLQLFVAKNPNFDIGNLTHEKFDALINFGHQQFESFISTYEPDLSEFRDAGGKMLTFHGLDDNVIPAKSTEAYYRAVASLDPDAQSFYRYFEVPGLAHCFGGSGGQPTAMFEQLRNWVENGTAPTSSPINFRDSKGKGWSRILCPFPQKAYFEEDCGDATVSRCWSCKDHSASRTNFFGDEL